MLNASIAKHLVFRIFFVISGGIFFSKKLKEHRSLILVIGVVTSLSTIFLLLDISDVFFKKYPKEGNTNLASKSVNYYEFTDLVDLIFNRMGGSGPFISWTDLRQLNNYFLWENKVLGSDGSTDFYVFRGETYLKLNEIPDVDHVYNKPQPWQVAAFGFTHHSASGIKFTRFNYDSEPLIDDLITRTRKGLKKAGFDLVKVTECKLIQSLGVFKIKKNGKHALLSFSFEGGTTGIYPSISLIVSDIKYARDINRGLLQELGYRCEG